MSLAPRCLGLLLLAGLAPALAACGFHPLYATAQSGSSAAGDLQTVYVDPIPERVGYELRNDLLDLFNSSANSSEHSAYRLQLTLRQEQEPLGFQGDASITRYNFRLVAHYELFALPKEDIVKKGDLHAITAYNVPQSPYATVTAEKDAEDRAAMTVAEMMRTELAVFFQDGAKPEHVGRPDAPVDDIPAPNTPVVGAPSSGASSGTPTQ
jgi:LPS-assembly lipoprotein